MTEPKELISELFSGKYIIKTKTNGTEIRFSLHKRLIFGIPGAKIRGFTIQRQRLELGIPKIGMIDWGEYTNYVMKGFNENATHTPMDLMHACIGFSAETGEILDEVKKHVFHKKAINKTELILEFGDAIWYLSALMSLMDVSFIDVIIANKAKLDERYKNGRQDLTFRDTKLEYNKVAAALNKGGHS